MHWIWPVVGFIIFIYILSIIYTRQHVIVDDTSSKGYMEYLQYLKTQGKMLPKSDSISISPKEEISFKNKCTDSHGNINQMKTELCAQKKGYNSLEGIFCSGGCSQDGTCQCCGDNLNQGTLEFGSGPLKEETKPNAFTGGNNEDRHLRFYCLCSKGWKGDYCDITNTRPSTNISIKNTKFNEKHLKLRKGSVPISRRGRV